MHKPLAWIGEGMPSAEIECPEKYRGTYQQYLKSPYWRAIRRRAVLEAGELCQKCKRNPKRHEHGIHLEVHHLSYERLGCEQPGDLQVLCNECHEIAHGLRAEEN